MSFKSLVVLLDVFYVVSFERKPGLIYWHEMDEVGTVAALLLDNWSLTNQPLIYFDVADRWN